MSGIVLQTTVVPYRAHRSSARQSIRRRNQHDISPTVSFSKFATFFNATGELMCDKSKRVRELECLGAAIASQNNLVELSSTTNLPTYARVQVLKTVNPWPSIAVLGTPACRRVCRPILLEPRAQRLAQLHSTRRTPTTQEAIQRASSSRDPRFPQRPPDIYDSGPRLHPLTAVLPRTPPLPIRSCPARLPWRWGPQAAAVESAGNPVVGAGARSRYPRAQLKAEVPFVRARSSWQHPRDDSLVSQARRFVSPAPPHAVRPFGSAALAARDSCLGAPPEQQLPFVCMPADDVVCPPPGLSRDRTLLSHCRRELTLHSPHPRLHPLRGCHSPARERYGAHLTMFSCPPTAADARSSLHQDSRNRDSVPYDGRGAEFHVPAAACDASAVVGTLGRGGRHVSCRTRSRSRARPRLPGTERRLDTTE
ncbi:hypothetical protein MSAN_02090100 [Mycena sanguinolenta]|uniref:Uncharacterized protein n=1 Tax=Mycena sanguinolenta TaxID=230812 RepID=A0A8H6XHB4_9AGAR|nr:hypothetical protein MSAN_02090100 [Mycena sanguinolenta]